MAKFEVTGGTRLKGEIIPQGAKNEALQILCAVLLTSEKVTIQEKVDAALIGGFIIRVGDKQLDASIASQIKQLKRDFSENEYVSEL